LESAYGYSEETIVNVLDKLLRTSQLKIEDAQSAWTSFRMYQKGKADFSDCLLGSTNRSGGCVSTVTFDQAASKLDGFQILS
jgi:predicted nucleic-acid-binding protein